MMDCMAAMIEHADEFELRIASILRQRDSQTLLEQLNARRVPCCRLGSVSSFIDSDLLKERQMWRNNQAPTTKHQAPGLDEHREELMTSSGE